MDALQLYLKEVLSYPPLSLEEERELVLLGQVGDQAAREQLVLRSLHLVVQILRPLPLRMTPGDLLYWAKVHFLSGDLSGAVRLVAACARLLFFASARRFSLADVIGAGNLLLLRCADSYNTSCRRSFRQYAVRMVSSRLIAAHALGRW